MTCYRLATLLCLLVHFCHALFLGNPDHPELVEQGMWMCNYPWVGGDLGYQLDHVFNRRVKPQSGSGEAIGPFKMRFNQGIVTVSGLNRAEIYTSLGIVEMDFTGRSRMGSLTQFQTDDRFTWGIGGRVILSEWQGIVFGVEGAYQQAQFHFSPTQQLAGIASAIKAGMHYHEWQLGAGMATTVDWFTPYIAAKYSAFIGNMHSGGDRLKLRSIEHFGLVLGFSLAAKRAFSLTVEARLFDEESISGAWSFKF